MILTNCSMLVRYDLSQDRAVPVMLTGFKTGEKNYMVDGDKSCREVREDKDAEVTRD